MEIALTTDLQPKASLYSVATKALLWKAWCESRARFIAAAILLASLVIYAVLTSPGFIARYNAHFPEKPLLYSVYVWSGLFHYALQGFWVIAAVLLAMGGLAQEKATGTALFTLSLPVSRRRVLLVRFGVAALQALALGLGSALLVPPISRLVGESYPLPQAVAFGALMSVAGMAVLTFGLLLSELFYGEFTAMVVGLCSAAAIFLAYKAHVLSGWNVFDVMSGTSAIDPSTQMLLGTAPWGGLVLCLVLTLVFLTATAFILHKRDA
jgi:ABC-type transport system involved in multi-copper enzyme maturation permease subunit